MSRSITPIDKDLDAGHTEGENAQVLERVPDEDSAQDLNPTQGYILCKCKEIMALKAKIRRLEKAALKRNRKFAHHPGQAPTIFEVAVEITT